MCATRLLIVVSAAVLAAIALVLALGGVRAAETTLNPVSESRAMRATLPNPHSGASGWTWPNGLPGFDFGSEDRFWNGTETSAAQRARIEADARASGMENETTRILKAIRISPSGDRIALIAASAPGRSDVCLEAAGRGLPRSFTCMRPGTRAAESSAFIAASIWNGAHNGRKMHMLYLLGVARGDITDIEFAAPGLAVWPLYHRSANSPWGTFALGVDVPKPWSGYLTLRRREGMLERIRLRSSDSGRRLLLPTGEH